jgi:hypothetical protein
MWCIPKINEEFIERMEALLDLYAKETSPGEPLICMDEKSKQLLMEVRTPLPMKEGVSKRSDYEYKRNGTRNVFLAVAPQEGIRYSCVTKRRTKRDFAEFVKYILDEKYPRATRIHLVCDNLNTHFSSSFYEAFLKEEADRLLSRIAFHYTPKHASWLNMAEIELSILGRQCINMRIPTEKGLKEKMRCWEEMRNAARSKIRWKFTVADARRKFKYETKLS